MDWPGCCGPKARNKSSCPSKGARRFDAGQPEFKWYMTPWLWHTSKNLIWGGLCHKGCGGSSGACSPVQIE